MTALPKAPNSATAASTTAAKGSASLGCAKFESCGDGVTEGTEECDDGVNDGTGPLSCLTGCLSPP